VVACAAGCVVDPPLPLLPAAHPATSASKQSIPMTTIAFKNERIRSMCISPLAVQTHRAGPLFRHDVALPWWSVMASFCTQMASQNGGHRS
jgi:hypothetical protein